MGQLADRLGYLAGRYGSDAAAWQSEIHAVASLEASHPRLALERFHALKRQFALFRRAQLLRELRSFAFVREVPDLDAQGYEMKEVEADIRSASRALGHARAIETAQEEEAEARSSLQRRTLPSAQALPVAAPWDALAALAEAAEARRRVVAREARLDRRLMDVERRARKLVAPMSTPSPQLPADVLERELGLVEERLRVVTSLEDAWRAALEPLKSPEVATYRHETKRALEREARSLLEAEDVAGLARLLARAEALRREAAALASQAARSRRKGLAPPERERRSSDTMDGYG